MCDIVTLFFYCTEAVGLALGISIVIIALLAVVVLTVVLCVRKCKIGMCTSQVEHNFGAKINMFWCCMHGMCVCGTTHQHVFLCILHM